MQVVVQDAYEATHTYHANLEELRTRNLLNSNTAFDYPSLEVQNQIYNT